MPTLVKLDPVTPVRPHLARWLVPGVNCTELQYRVVQRAMEDDGIMESPSGSNRGVSIDRWLRAAGVPESLITTGKGWWCAAWVGAVWRDMGCLVPRDYASCDSWLPFIQPDPVPGAAILYGVRGNAHHIGIVSRVSPMLVTIEGNRAFAGTTNNGVCVDQGPPQRRDILGFIHPRAA